MHTRKPDPRPYGYEGAQNLYSLKVSYHATSSPYLAPGLNYRTKAPTVTEGDAFWVESYIYNAGPAPSEPSQVKLFLSTDNDWDLYNDYYVDEKYVPALPAQSGTWVRWDFTMPNIGSVGYNVWLMYETYEALWMQNDHSFDFTAYDKYVSPGEALDATYLVWSTGGDNVWFGQTANSFYGGDAARSGSILDGQGSWLRTAVDGAGSLSFYWAVSSGGGSDWLRFYIDGLEQPGSISGGVSWQQKTYDLGPGSHTLEWKYKKDTSYSSGADAGWVDKVVWTPLPTVTIAATDATATEAGQTTGTFTVNRTGSTTTDLTVYYGVSGTATAGGDYRALSGSVMVQAGSATATITVNPIDDSYVENNETVVVTLSANAAYTVGSPNSATVTIISDDIAPPSSITVPANDADGNYSVNWGASGTAGVTYVLQEATNASFTVGLLILLCHKDPSV